MEDLYKWGAFVKYVLLSGDIDIFFIFYFPIDTLNFYCTCSEYEELYDNQEFYFREH